MKNYRKIISGLAICTALTGVALADAKQAGHTDKAEAKETTYPVATCVVSGQKLGSMGEPYAHELEGRKVFLCCAGCVNRLEGDPENYLEKYDKLVVKHQKASYPLDTCVVSGQALDAMGGPVDIVHGDRLVRLCCAGCENGFNRNPDRYLEKIDHAAAEQAKAKSHNNPPVAWKQRGHDHHKPPAAACCPGH